MSCHQPSRYHHGFTLLELSIVLVIIGLITGGILGGQAMIRTSEVQSIAKDYNRYVTVVTAFKTRFNALPGDMPNATRFWGELSSNPTTCKNTASTDARTCDGNGNQKVEADATKSQERWRFWQHLGNAGLLSGNYKGVFSTVPGEGSPANKLNAFMDLRSPAVLTGHPSFWDKKYQHFMFFGKSPTLYAHGAVLTPKEAWQIDTKMDDGLPGYGIIMSYRTNTPEAWAVEGKNCADSTTQSSARYAVSVPRLLCPLMIDLRF